MSDANAILLGLTIVSLLCSLYLTALIVVAWKKIDHVFDIVKRKDDKAKWDENCGKNLL